eukprot:TRINITY_DN14121_c0_g1_i1.p1 TRINITY_DN14121_c0_g1~~TRINITY_DN14121_c0_g1_i1.p1  ORF type:complete len:385 (-),score=54.06 TRINITY_DN14121_c0_g1_i1:153-1307(-)
MSHDLNTISHSVENRPPSFLSSLLLLWVYPLLRGGKQGSLLQDSFLPTPEGSDSQSQGELFWKLRQTKEKASFTVWKLLRGDFLKAVGLACTCSAVKIAAVFTVRALAQFILDKESSPTEGVAYAALLAGLSMLEAIGLSQANLKMSSCAVKLASIFTSVVYTKAGSLHPFVKQKHKRGDLVNLALNDTGRIVDSAMFIVVGVSAPVLLLFSLVTAVILVGPSALIIFFWTAVITFVVHNLGKRQGASVKRKMMLQGKRLSSLNEMLQAMKVVKLSAWEESFEDSIGKIRSDEERALKIMRVLQSVTNPICIMLTPLASLSTILIYLAIHGQLPSMPDTIALINILRNISVPLTLLGTVFSTVFSLMGNLQRLNDLVAERESWY